MAFRPSFLAAAALFAVSALAQDTCTPTFTSGTTYNVSMTELPSFVWVNNGTIGSLGVNLRTTVAATPWYLSPTGFGGYVFSLDTEMSSCLYASDNAHYPGVGGIYSSLGCYDAVGEFDLDEDFTFSCVECYAGGGGSNCEITSSLSKQCVNTPDNELHYPSGEDELDQVKTATCSSTWYQRWDVNASS
uniref:Uncharacterized protein n=1 Tax=Mycena chlorophos TaxID=658473 RepID=A0ABQ0LP05_MYCCL|nr:predicted protein [Mycena chlorophos]